MGTCEKLVIEIFLSCIVHLQVCITHWNNVIENYKLGESLSMFFFF